jgi:bacterioferritin (cytochrome b1)
LDEAVADGRVSEEKAAKIRERIESGEGVPFFQHHRPHRQGGQVVGKVAEFLGLTPQEVVEALKDGQSLAQIAEENGVSSDKLSAFVLGELEARLAEAVENGKMTQERADENLATAEERIDRLINHEGLPKARPHRFGPKGRFDGGFRDGGFGQPLPEDGAQVF